MTTSQVIIILVVAISLLVLIIHHRRVTKPSGELQIIPGDEGKLLYRFVLYDEPETFQNKDKVVFTIVKVNDTLN